MAVPGVATFVLPPRNRPFIANDLVALEVLAANVPIPGVWMQNGGTDVLLLTSIWLPALFTRGVAAPSNRLRADGTCGGFLPPYNLNFVVR